MQSQQTVQQKTSVIAWSEPLAHFRIYRRKRGLVRPGSLNIFLSLLAQPVNLEKAFVFGQGKEWVLYYNPQLHSQLSMELVCQMIEKYQFDYHAKEYERQARCCRADYHFKVHTIVDLKGAKHFREDLEPLILFNILQPNTRISIGFHMHYNQNVFCCCEENGCNIF
eukprot:403334702